MPQVSLMGLCVNQPLCGEMEAQSRARVFTKYKIQGEKNRDSSVGKVLATQAQDPTLDPLPPCEHKQALCNNEHLRFQHRGYENRRSPVGHWLANLPCQICSRLSKRPHFKKQGARWIKECYDCFVVWLRGRFLL